MIDDLDWYGPETATFGDRLSAAIEKSGMTQKLVAKRLGIKLVTLKSWEQDVSEPRANRLSMLCLLYTSPSPRDISGSRMPSSA